MKKINLVCTGIITSILGQNLAMAYDMNRFQSLSPEAQQARSVIHERINGMSEHAKLKLSYKLYKVALKILPAMEKMSDGDFNQKIQSSVQDSNAVKTEVTGQQEEVLSKSDLQEALPMNSSLKMSEASMAQVRNTHFNQTDITQRSHQLIEQIGYKTDANGHRKPLSRSDFSERVLSYANQSAKKLRSVADVDWESILDTLLVIVIIGAAVGLVVLFGWMGLAIALGSLIVFVITWVIVQCANWHG